MKKVLFTLMLLVSTMACFAQAKHDAYCELVGTSKFLSTKVTVEVDFGQSKWADAHLYDENGKKISFNSMMDALNYMGKRGWTLTQTYAITSGSSNVYHYVLVKQVEKDEDITEGINLKQK